MISVACDVTPAPASDLANFGTMTPRTTPSIAMPEQAMKAG